MEMAKFEKVKNIGWQFLKEQMKKFIIKWKAFYSVSMIL